MIINNKQAPSVRNKNTFIAMLCLLALLIILPFTSGIVSAQDVETSATNITIKEDIIKENIPFPASLFFTPEEISAIQRAILGIDTPDEDASPKAPRVLRMSGMLYQSPNNWVIWLNGKRITPDRLLPEIIDISVDSSKVHLKWFDYGLNDVISITLRPHQVYDIETGILLPG